MAGRFLSAALVVYLGAGWALADPTASKRDKALQNFGSLTLLPADEARAQVDAWLKSIGKTDDATRKAVDAIWGDDDRSILDRVTESLLIGSPEAKQLLSETRDPKASPPTSVPAILRDTKINSFLRANLGLAYAKALSDRRVYEESLECLKGIKAEQVVDPGQYLFLKLVAEHSLLMKSDAYETIGRLLDDVPDAPDRYKAFAVLALVEMQQWKDKDLGWIERKMGNIERRLDLARGGKKTQEIERQVVARLDEMIKELENRDGDPGPNGGNCPNGGDGPPGNTNQPSSPMRDSKIATNTGPGMVDSKTVKILTENWGKLPEKERAKALADLTRDMPPAFRESIEEYFHRIGQQPGEK
jgi:hypothetical protein